MQNAKTQGKIYLNSDPIEKSSELNATSEQI